MTAVPADAVARVDDLFRDRVATGVAPSSVWGVFDAAGLVAAGGHGDRGDGRAPDADTVYRIASCTKSVTAATLLRLVDRGLVGLEDPITRWVPAFDAVTPPGGEVPTVQMLLTMSGGLPTDDPWADRQESVSDDELDAVLRAGLLFDSVPGTRFAYSNLGYALLGRVIASASGTAYPRAATEAVLDPLGLRSTRFAADELGDRFVVTGTRPYGGAFEPLTTTGPGAFSSIGGLFSTVRDLSTWARHLRAAFTDPGAPSPVRAVDRRRMQQSARAVPGRRRQTGYGLGLFVEQDDRVGPIASHSGGYPGFAAHMRWSIRTGVGVVAFENATGARVSVAAERAHDLLLDAMPAPDAVGVALPETLAAQGAVTRLLADWVDGAGDGVDVPSLPLDLVTPNVAMDSPADRRRDAAVRVFATTGADPRDAPARTTSDAPSHLRWELDGPRGTARVEIRLAPIVPARVQSIVVTVVER